MSKQGHIKVKTAFKLHVCQGVQHLLTAGFSSVIIVAKRVSSITAIGNAVGKYYHHFPHK